MKIKLAYKLFGALFLTLLLMLGALELSRYLFARNFKEYILQVKVERLESLVPLLQEEYRNNDGWSGIENNIHYWRKRLHYELQLPNYQPSEYRKRGMATKRHRIKHFNSGPRYLLSDVHLRPIIGQPSPGDNLQLVEVQVEGKSVGWLGLTQNKSFKKGPPADFANRQFRLFYILGGMVLIITMIIAVLLTRHLLRPIKRLSEGTQSLANRDFSVRMEGTGRDELGQLAEHFNTMAETLQAYERLRKQWLSDISHELRTPIAILRGEIESLLDGVRRPTRKNLQSLQAETLRIGKLVEDLHVISMADSNELKLNKQSISPVEVLTRTIDLFQASLVEKQIRLDLHCQVFNGVSIRGDADRLGQVFSNVLNNACKYVSPPGVVSVTARAEHRFITICFKDSGPGVPKESLPRLFDRLYRVDTSRGRGHGGSGLGLSICKHIVEYHKGSISAENNTDGGLTIRIRLPLEIVSICQEKE